MRIWCGIPTPRLVMSNDQFYGRFLFNLPRQKTSMKFLPSPYRKGPWTRGHDGSLGLWLILAAMVPLRNVGPRFIVMLANLRSRKYEIIRSQGLILIWSNSGVVPTVFCFLQYLFGNKTIYVLGKIRISSHDWSLSVPSSPSQY